MTWRQRGHATFVVIVILAIGACGMVAEGCKVAVEGIF